MNRRIPIRCLGWNGTHSDPRYKWDVEGAACWRPDPQEGGPYLDGICPECGARITLRSTVRTPTDDDRGDGMDSDPEDRDR